MPIDLSCISEKLLQQLAELTDASILADFRDKKDKMLSKLYKRRLELDFRNPSPSGERRDKQSDLLTVALAGDGASATNAAALASSVHMAAHSKICFCKWCGKLFHSGASHLLPCSMAPLTVDFRGNMATRHVVTEGWSLTECVSRLHKNGMAWEEIYWLLWGEYGVPLASSRISLLHPPARANSHARARTRTHKNTTATAATATTAATIIQA